MRLILVLLFPCVTFAQQTINDSIIHNNVIRYFITYIPAVYNSSTLTPLLFNLHGRTSDASSQMWYGDFRPIADTAGFIIVHPQGLLDNTGVTHWNIGQSSVDDIGFIEVLYQKLTAEYNINLDKVYSTGMSNGGYMSYYLACDMSDKFAAIASVTGAMASYTQLICNPVHPTPVMEIHGTTDSTVPFNDIVSGLEYWRNYNNCDALSDTTTIPDVVLTDFSTVEHIVYKNGDNGVTTELFKVINGEHSWPGTSFPAGVTNYDINASIEIWRFFSRYDINGLIGTTAIPEQQRTNKKKLIKIVDVLGRVTNKPQNRILFYIFDDGTVEKKIIIE